MIPLTNLSKTKTLMDFEKSLFRIDIPTGSPDAGKLLVSEPFMTDQYFSHSVISLVDYDRDGTSMGIVMNRATSYTVGQLIEGFDDDVDAPVFCGGPLSPDRLFYIHRLGNLFTGCREISRGLWIGGDFDQMKEYVAAGNPTAGLIRFFIGYSGWEARQLDREISQHVWAVADALSPKKMLTGADDAYWHRMVRTMGEEYRPWLLHPMNPQAN